MRRRTLWRHLSQRSVVGSLAGPRVVCPGSELTILEGWACSRVGLLPDGSVVGSAVVLGLTEPTAAAEG